MRRTEIVTILLLVFCLMICRGELAKGASIGTAFTYQGRLMDHNEPADGLYDFQFELFDANEVGTQLGSTIDINDLDVIDGYFTVELDFGAVFDGNARWLETTVAHSDGSDPCTLSPRQEMTPTPYALYADAAGSDNDWMISGDNIYAIPSGYIGIGTNDPLRKLHVQSSDIPEFDSGNLSWEDVIIEDSENAWLGLYSDETGGLGAGLTFAEIGAEGSINKWGIYRRTSANVGDLNFTYGPNINPGANPKIMQLYKNGNILMATVNGNVGIGTMNPTAKLQVDSSTSSGSIISATNTGSGFDAYAIYGSVSGSSGRGVCGRASGTGSGINYGGHFTADSEMGKGVYGYASNKGDVENYGGHFLAHGGTGRGVYGHASNNSSGENYGGYFKAEGEHGRGVYGEASKIAAGVGVVQNYGGYFISKGDFGIGVYGEASTISDDNSNYGGYFEAKGQYGRGVYGLASNSGNYINEGGYFEARGTSGRGVLGEASGSNGRGVEGYATGSNGQGVHGWGVAYDFYAANPGSTDYGSASSIRWKKNVRLIGNPLDKVLRLRGVYFNWDAEHGGGHDVGMIAEEVGEVLPEIVEYEENGIDASGMDYSKLTPLLVESVKALKAEIDQKDTVIETLQKQNEMLQKRVTTIEAMVDKLAILQKGGVK